MEFQDLIEARRSVRKYDDSKSVSREDIEKLISAGLEAPSWKNQQTSRYRCLIDREVCDRFRAECFPSFNSERSKGCALIVCTFVKNVVGFNKETGLPDNELGNGWGCYDLGLQSQNIVLKAKELGLDTLIMGIRSEDKIRDFLEIPQEEILVSVIAVGYGAEEPKRPARKAVDEIAKFY